MEVSQAPPEKPSRRKALLAFAAVVVVIGGALAANFLNWGPTKTLSRQPSEEQPRITDADLADLIEDNRKSLDLSNAAVTDDGLAPIEGLKDELMRLNLQGTRITDRGLTHVKPLTRLRELNLAGTKITDAGLANLEGLRDLRTLNLHATHITDEGVKRYLVKLPSLEQVSITGTKITLAGRDELKKALPDCKIFPPLQAPKPPPSPEKGEKPANG